MFTISDEHDELITGLIPKDCDELLQGLITNKDGTYTILLGLPHEISLLHASKELKTTKDRIKGLKRIRPNTIKFVNKHLRYIRRSASGLLPELHVPHPRRLEDMSLYSITVDSLDRIKIITTNDDTSPRYFILVDNELILHYKKYEHVFTLLSNNYIRHNRGKLGLHNVVVDIDPCFPSTVDADDIPKLNCKLTFYLYNQLKITKITQSTVSVDLENINAIHDIVCRKTLMEKAWKELISIQMGIIDLDTVSNLLKII